MAGSKVNFRSWFIYIAASPLIQFPLERLPHPFNGIINQNVFSIRNFDQVPLGIAQNSFLFVSSHKFHITLLFCYSASLDDELKAFIATNANTPSDKERSHKIIQDIPDLKKEQMGDEDDPPEILVKHAPRVWCFIWTSTMKGSNSPTLGSSNEKNQLKPISDSQVRLKDLTNSKKQKIIFYVLPYALGLYWQSPRGRQLSKELVSI